MKAVKERFDEFKNKSYFSRVDADHPLELMLGLDDNGRKALKLRANFKPLQIKGTSSIEVRQFKGDIYNTIMFSLTEEEISNLFYYFCEDLIESTRDVAEKSLAYQAVTNRFFLWKKLFLVSKNKLLTEPEIMGLIGEIVFLSTELFDKYNKHDALKGWSGQELTHKDFSYEDTWYEVKAINTSSQSVKISSIEQLESSIEGALTVVRLEKMSPAFNGFTLNKLVKDVSEMFENNEDIELFLNKVAIQGFIFNDYYDDFVYALSDVNKFVVNESFPRLTRETISSAICKAQYEITLKDIVSYLIK